MTWKLVVNVTGMAACGAGLLSLALSLLLAWAGLDFVWCGFVLALGPAVFTPLLMRVLISAFRLSDYYFTKGGDA